MSTSATRRPGRQALGHSLTEVVVIVFLVGIGCIGVVGLFGDNIRGLFGGGSESLAGSPSVGNPGQETQKTEWTLRGGSLSAYGNSNGYNPGGTSDAPQSAPDPGGGFNPGGSSGDRHSAP